MNFQIQVTYTCSKLRGTHLPQPYRLGLKVLISETFFPLALPPKEHTWPLIQYKIDFSNLKLSLNNQQIHVRNFVYQA
jgi:hypothetical protein